MVERTDEDRIEIRKQQIENIRDMIAWEQEHNWGIEDRVACALSAQIIQDRQRLIATLESATTYLTDRVANAHGT